MNRARLHGPIVDAHAPGATGRATSSAQCPRNRQPVLDRLAGASRRFQVHALVELDVTAPKARIARRGAARLVDRVRHRDPGARGRAPPRGERPQGGQSHPHLRPRRHRRDRRTAVGGATRSSTSSRSATPTGRRAPRSPRCCTRPSTVPASRTAQSGVTAQLRATARAAPADGDPGGRDETARRGHLRARGGRHLARDVLERLGVGHPARAADRDRDRGRRRGPAGRARRAASWRGRCCR